MLTLHWQWMRNSPIIPRSRQIVKKLNKIAMSSSAPKIFLLVQCQAEKPKVSRCVFMLLGVTKSMVVSQKNLCHGFFVDRGILLQRNINRSRGFVLFRGFGKRKCWKEQVSFKSWRKLAQFICSTVLENFFFLTHYEDTVM